MGGDLRIYENSIFPAYVPEKNNNRVSRLKKTFKKIFTIFNDNVTRNSPT